MFLISRMSLLIKYTTLNIFGILNWHHSLKKLPWVLVLEPYVFAKTWIAYYVAQIWFCKHKHNTAARDKFYIIHRSLVSSMYPTRHNFMI